MYIPPPNKTLELGIGVYQLASVSYLLLCNFYSTEFTVRAEMKMQLGQLSKEIEKLIGVDEANFIMYRVERDMEFECVNEWHTPLEALQRFQFIRARLGHRLTKNEARYPVFLFDINSNGVRTRTHSISIQVPPNTFHIILLLRKYFLIVVSAPTIPQRDYTELRHVRESSF